MNKIFNAFIVLLAVQSIDAFSQEVVEETVVVTSALVDTNHMISLCMLSMVMKY